MKKAKILLFSIIFALIIFSIVCTFAGYSLCLINYSDMHTYYSNINPPKEDDGLWIHPRISGSRRNLCLVPFFGYRSEGPPYSVGIVIVDYYNNHRCQELEIIDLDILINQQKFQLIRRSFPPISSKFQTYIDRVSHTKAECLINTGDLIKRNNKTPVTIHVRYKIHQVKDIYEGEMNVVANPSHNVGFYSIMEAFNE